MIVGIAGGGTGGHLFPGLAVAECARRRSPPHEVIFFGADRGIESRLVPQAGFELFAEPLEGLVGRSPAAAARALFKMSAALLRTRRLCRERGIEVMVGLGGYASAPAVLAACSCRIPVVLLEQNRFPGVSNRMLSRLAVAVCSSFPTRQAASSSRFSPLYFHTGNPLRSELDREPLEGSRDRLLIFGGSGGARSLNRAVPRALAALAGLGDAPAFSDAAGRPEPVKLPPIVHQAGLAAVEEVKAAYAQAGLEAQVLPFIDDMASAYASAKLSVCRAGATSIAELIATATPAVLIPLPNAAADHQHANAVELEEAGAACVVRDDENCVQNLTEVLGGLLKDPARLSSMASRIRELARPGAAQRVLDIVEKAAAGSLSPSSGA